ncbi:hypothetical protein TIFTF001_006304 [Ficus carica]|uniref:Uncharacterized protein n=1 Tax=Ficus carica TaxID=3494 RepID=A0AA87ZIJ9_FICCA|nr:hypothetical protein TIFTF001_006304 [Ficus carica]
MARLIKNSVEKTETETYRQRAQSWRWEMEGEKSEFQNGRFEKRDRQLREGRGRGLGWVGGWGLTATVERVRNEGRIGMGLMRWQRLIGYRRVPIFTGVTGHVGLFDAKLHALSL